jgi:ribose transport system ATP-binding protein
MNLEVRPGRVHTLLGENGAGKSTLMKILAGVYHAHFGRRIVLTASPIQAAEPARRPRARPVHRLSGTQPLQQPDGGREHLGHAMSRAGLGFINDRELNAAAERWSATSACRSMSRAKVGDLSIAQRQLVEIAKGLSLPADVVILDEPTSSLSDSRGRDPVLDHRTAEGARQGGHLHLAPHGRDHASVRRHHRHPRRRICRHARSARPPSTELIALMVGREMNEIYPPRVSARPTADAPPVLASKNLTATASSRTSPST